MDHLKEIQGILKRQVPKVEPGQIVYLKPDSTVALFEAQQTIEHLSKLVYLNAAESQRLHVKMQDHHRQCEQRICDTERDAFRRVRAAEERAEKVEQEFETKKSSIRRMLDTISRLCKERAELKRDHATALRQAKEAADEYKARADRLEAYCREQEQASNSKHRIRAVYLENGGLINDSLPITRVEGDSRGIVVYVKA